MIAFCGNCRNHWGLIENPLCMTCDKSAAVPTNWMEDEDLMQASIQAVRDKLAHETVVQDRGAKADGGMSSEVFERLLNEQLDRSRDVLCTKANEYATGDRLHNFRVAAGLRGCSLEQAVAGMMAKHTVSVYDMCESGKDYPIALWAEKITDSINYLLLLNAVVREGK